MPVVQKEFNILGAKVSLDRLLPPADGSETQPLQYDYMYCNPLCDIEGLTPYACTFTVPFDNDAMWNSAPEVNDQGSFSSVAKLKCLDDQMKIMKQWIDSWLLETRRSMARLAPNNRDIAGYVVTFEVTKKGMIHAHGLLLMNNMYYSAVRDIMALCWLKITGANQKAMVKDKGRFLDHAFDKCNDIDAWMRYILKGKHLIPYDILMHKYKDDASMIKSMAEYQRSMLCWPHEILAPQSELMKYP